MASTFLLQAVAYPGALYWLRVLPLRNHGFWMAGAMTIGITILAIALCISWPLMIPDEVEYMIGGIVLVASAATEIV